ncbi:DUF1365 domain-containing protein [Euryhalocaulis caribicus]|uniref:DUF1365 domain-containing protein n=1 Tax=Euryhalocaulis caribicus TaxID=1161401 RepID=UPI00039DBE6E|nr:DUF1365 domain-containing protein [Euryhalocaulis caribicus]
MTPAAGISFYPGRTDHERLTPFRHAFSYRIFPFLLDMDRLDETASALRFFSHNSLNLFSLHDTDHGARDGSDPCIWARKTFADAGVSLDGGSLSLLCFPRVLNYAFNPLSVWFGRGPSGELRGLIYEVHNTFGHAHSYVAPALREGPQHHRTEKVFHVSPFFPVAGDYDFDLKGPDDRFTLAIRKTLETGHSLTATMSLRHQPVTDSLLLSRFARTPFMTIGVITAIHWQALKLKLKGARYHSPPEPPSKPTLANPRG